jgi:hypothetical protein
VSLSDIRDRRLAVENDTEGEDTIGGIRGGDDTGRGVDLQPFYMAIAVVAVPASWFVTQFAGGIAKGLGDDSYRALKKSITNWWLATHKHDAAESVELPPPVEGSGGAPLVEVTPNLPREAFTALAAVDWTTQPHGTYRFDAETGKWTVKP